MSSHEISAVMNEYQKKLSKIYCESIDRDIFGRRKALASEIARILGEVTFEQLESFYTPDREVIKQKEE